MKVVMYQKKYVVNEPIREVELKGDFDDYYHGEDKINEELLLQNIPSDFLSHLKPQDLTIMVEDEIAEEVGRVLGHSGQKGLSLFTDYNKYSSPFSLLLCRYE